VGRDARRGKRERGRERGTAPRTQGWWPDRNDDDGETHRGGQRPRFRGCLVWILECFSFEKVSQIKRSCFLVSFKKISLILKAS
jgi:hypothetical protein